MYIRLLVPNWPVPKYSLSNWIKKLNKIKLRESVHLYTFLFSTLFHYCRGRLNIQPNECMKQLLNPTYIIYTLELKRDVIAKLMGKEAMQQATPNHINKVYQANDRIFSELHS